MKRTNFLNISRRTNLFTDFRIHGFSNKRLFDSLRLIEIKIRSLVLKNGFTGRVVPNDPCTFPHCKRLNVQKVHTFPHRILYLERKHHRKSSLHLTQCERNVSLDAAHPQSQTVKVIIDFVMTTLQLLDRT